MVKYLYESISAAAGIMIVAFNLLFLSESFPLISPILNVIGGLIAVIPPTLLVYARYRTRKEMESQFLEFIGDLTDSINSGMTLPMSLENCSKRDYFALSGHINGLASQVNWGVPFELALDNFSKKVNTVTVSRAVTTIIETYKVGGKISDTLNAVGKSLITIEKINKERSASVHAQIVTSYMIFFIFIGILLVLQVFLLPALTPSATSGISHAATTTGVGTAELYATGFMNFIVIQGFFAGLATGKMAEGSIVAGFKHSILLIAVGYTIFSFASQFSIDLF